MSRKIKILSESSCDLPKELLERYGFDTVPMPVSVDGAAYKDGVDIDSKKLFELVKSTGKTPKTSAQPMGVLIDFFKSYTEQGFDVIYFSLSSKLSASANNAKLACEEVEGAYAVDTLSLSTGIALLMIKAAEYIEKNPSVSAPEVVTYINDFISKDRASFVIDTLDYLHKGGRCSALAAFGANLLKLKPCLELIEGKIEVTKKYRGSIDLALVEYVENKLKTSSDIDLDRVFITHSGFPSQKTVDEILKKISQLASFKEIHITNAGAGISCHCGPGTLGVLFLLK